MASAVAPGRQLFPPTACNSYGLSATAPMVDPDASVPVKSYHEVVGWQKIRTPCIRVTLLQTVMRRRSRHRIKDFGRRTRLLESGRERIRRSPFCSTHDQSRQTRHDHLRRGSAWLIHTARAFSAVPRWHCPRSAQGVRRPASGLSTPPAPSPQWDCDLGSSRPAPPCWS